MNKKAAAKDPTQFFLNQNLQIPEQKKKLAYEFSKRLLNNQKCPICNKDYDLNEHVPKILIQCGHTFCISCLEMFFKNYLIRCPMCLKLLKRLRAVDVLPTNHTIHARLIKELPPDKINPFFEKLA